METEQAEKSKTGSSFSPQSLPLFSNAAVVDGTGPSTRIALNQPCRLQEAVGRGACHTHRKQRRTVLVFFR